MKKPASYLLLIPCALPFFGCVSRRADGESLADFLRRMGGAENLSVEEEIAAAPTPLPLTDDEVELWREELTGEETTLTLDECLELALSQADSIAVQTSRRHVAEALHRQSLSRYWPQIGARIYATILGTETTFGLPEIVYDIDPISFQTQAFDLNTPDTAFSLPGATIATPGSTINTPDSSLALPGSTIALPASSISLPGSNIAIPGSTIALPGSSITTPGGVTQIPGSQIVIPGSTITTPETRSAPSKEFPDGQLIPGQIIEIPSQTISLPGSSIPFAGSVIPIPATNIAVNGTTIPIPGQLIPIAGQDIPIAGQNVPIAGQAIPIDGQNIPIPGSDIPIPGQTIPIPARDIELPGQRFVIPAREVPVSGQLTYGGSLDVTWLLLDGGERSARRKASLAGIDAAREQERKAAAALLADVRRFYWGAVTARELLTLADDVLIRMEAALDLTEQFYLGDSLKVSRLDFLKAKVLVETHRAVRVEVAGQYQVAVAALTHAVGLDFTSRILPASANLPPLPETPDLDAVMDDGFRFSPDWKTLLADLESAVQEKRIANSGFWPKLTLQGSLFRAESDISTGLSTDASLNNWRVTVAAEMPIWTGGYNRAQLAIAKARIEELESAQVLLRRTLGLDVKKQVIEMQTSAGQAGAFDTASITSLEHRELTDEAYRNELAETEDMLDAIYGDALVEAKRIRSRHSALEAQIELDQMVGGAFAELIEATMNAIDDDTSP